MWPRNAAAASRMMTVSTKSSRSSPDTLPAPLYETAYALAVEVAAVDLHVEQEELRFLQILRDYLEVDKLIAAAIERSARVRYRLAEPRKN